jgi:hypothetical protein
VGLGLAQQVDQFTGARSRALTVKQPSASLIIAGYKVIENRSRYTRHRGPLAIHAGTDIDLEEMSKHAILVNRLVRELGPLPHEVVLGTVTVVDCVNDSRSRWAKPDTWNWKLANAHRFRYPVPARGRLGLWEW